ncbi:MAG TPA: cation diffusion facilitator family transporter [Ktedonobacteraceae bacterium]|nr:cation diffusion facilitator family transporter [Ktedonobacteraceae bacterium]
MNIGHAGHDHTHGMAIRSLRIAFFLSTIILVAGLVGGLLAHSLALISDAAHTVTDLFALGLAWFAAVQAERPSNERKTFGYHRVGILAALLNAVTLIVIALVICWEAIQRFHHPEPVQPLIMFGAAAIAICINLFIAFGLQKDSHNLNVRAATLHVMGDVGASVGVIIGGIIILFTGWTIVDPLLSIGIALLIAIGSWQILRETTDILLEAVPKGISLSNLVSDMKAVSGVLEVHDLHVWSIASGMSALSCHVLIDNLPPSDSSPILQSLTHILNEKYHIGHSTIQFECNTSKGACCETRNLYCRLEASGASCCDHEHHIA